MLVWIANINMLAQKGRYLYFYSRFITQSLRSIAIMVFGKRFEVIEHQKNQWHRQYLQVIGSNILTIGKLLPCVND
jgi:hypothetical protein